MNKVAVIDSVTAANKVDNYTNRLAELKTAILNNLCSVEDADAEFYTYARNAVSQIDSALWAMQAASTRLSRLQSVKRNCN